MKFRIYTMYINRKDLLVEAIESLEEYRSQVVILDNSAGQDLALDGFPGEIIRPPVPLFVSQSYNLFCKTAQERHEDLFFVMHSDAVASDLVIRLMLDRAAELERRQVNWGAMFTNYDVLVLYNTHIIRQFPWDQLLPAYYTDVDHSYRLKIAGVKMIETGLPVVHNNGGSSAMKSDHALHEWVTTNYPAWREYYLRKWGGERDQERYILPFNGAGERRMAGEAPR